MRLPQQPGTYGLQLIATNPKGITAFSNNMLITVKTVEPLSDHRDKSATGQAIPDPKSPSPTTTTVPQPDSIVNDDPKLSQHLAPSGFSEKTPITEEASYSESSDRRDLDPRRGSIMSVSTTTSNEGIVAPRTSASVCKENIKNIENIAKYAESKLKKYLHDMNEIKENSKIEKVKQISTQPESDNRRIDLNNISSEDLLSIHGVSPSIAARILFIREMTDGKGEIQDYRDGITLTDPAGHKNPIRGLDKTNLKKKSKYILLGENYDTN